MTKSKEQEVFESLPESIQDEIVASAKEVAEITGEELPDYYEY